ncbi:MAG: hypothetical protein FIA97_08575 [Methylococcaceae bacterium]|nr:hypothetical protein [Methylococcaceae bacterium]
MQAKALGIIGALVSAAAPLGASAAETPADVKQLQDENRRLAEQLQSAQAEIKKLKQTAPAAPSASREMSAPFAEETSAKGGAPVVAPTPTSIATKDFTLAVGTKVWINGWSTWRSLKLNIPGFPQFIDKGVNIQSVTAKSSSAVSPIPSLTARYKDFFLTGSYLAETDYEFSDQSQLYSIDLRPLTGRVDPVGLKYGMSGSRREWDVSLGYQIIPYLAVTAGYKEIEQSFKIDSCQGVLMNLTDVFDCRGDFPGKTKVTYAGPTIGLSGAAPIGHGFGLYGNFTYGWLGANFRSSSASQFNDLAQVNNVDYYVGELGLTYSHLLRDMPVYMPLSAATAYAGYRYQSYESHLSRHASNGNNPKDTVQGFVAGVNLAF